MIRLPTCAPVLPTYDLNEICKWCGKRFGVHALHGHNCRIEGSVAWSLFDKFEPKTTTAAPASQFMGG